MASFHYIILAEKVGGGRRGRGVTLMEESNEVKLDRTRIKKTINPLQRDYRFPSNCIAIWEIRDLSLRCIHANRQQNNSNNKHGSSLLSRVPTYKERFLPTRKIDEVDVDIWKSMAWLFHLSFSFFEEDDAEQRPVPISCYFTFKKHQLVAR